MSKKEILLSSSFYPQIVPLPWSLYPRAARSLLRVIFQVSRFCGCSILHSAPPPEHVYTSLKHACLWVLPRMLENWLVVFQALSLACSGDLGCSGGTNTLKFHSALSCLFPPLISNASRGYLKFPCSVCFRRLHETELSPDEKGQSEAQSKHKVPLPRLLLTLEGCFGPRLCGAKA